MFELATSPAPKCPTVAIAIVIAALIIGASIYVAVTSTSAATVTATTRSTVTVTSATTVTTTLTQNNQSSTTQSSYNESFPSPANQSFQFIEGQVAEVGSSSLVNATFESELSNSSQINVVGVAYSAETSNPEGLPGGIACCPIVKSYSAAIAATAIDQARAGPHAWFSSTLLFPSSLNGTYLVKLYITSPAGLLLSPISDMLLQVSGGRASGGQADAGSSFFDNDNGLLYVLDGGLDAVTVVNGSADTIAATISLPNITQYMSIKLYDPASHTLFISDGARTYEVNTSSNFIVGSLNQTFSSMLYDPQDGLVFGFGSESVLVLNSTTNGVVSTIGGIEGATSGIYDAERQQPLTEASNGTIFDLHRTGASAVASLPNSTRLFLYDPDNNLLYASEPYNQSTGQDLVALDGSTLQPAGPTIKVSSSPASFVLYDSFNGDLYFYSGPSSIGLTGGALIAIDGQSGTISATIPVQGVNGGLVIEQPSFVLDSANGDLYGTSLTDPTNGTVGLLHILASSNMIASETFPPKMPLNFLALDARDGMLYGAYDMGSPTIFSLNLASGAVTTIQIGDLQAYTLPP